jgi:hypothetical protein
MKARSRQDQDEITQQEQDKTRQDKTRQGTTRQDKARHDTITINSRQDKTRQKQDKTLAWSEIAATGPFCKIRCKKDCHVFLRERPEQNRAVGSVGFATRTVRQDRRCRPVVSM